MKVEKVEKVWKFESLKAAAGLRRDPQFSIFNL